MIKILSDEAKKELYQGWLNAICFTDEATKNLIDEVAKEAQRCTLEQVMETLKKQGAVWVDKNYAIIQMLEKELGEIDGDISKMPKL